MNFEKRSAGGSAPPEPPEPADAGKKPVLIYIIILFLAAFILMGISLLAHQRRNTEALGQLQSDLSAMQEIQTTQEEIIRLQKQLDEAEEQQSSLTAQLEEAQAASDAAEKEAQALLALYTLQQEYLTGDLDGCRITLQEISDQELAAALPESGTAGVTSPAQRYQELKEAVINQP